MAEPLCPNHCAKWASESIGYCLCSAKDGFSLGLGFLSVVSWSVAEIPQIITNYKTKSTQGLSFAFLITWIIGDFLNLFGCMLEPATLPTQYYMALLYTVTTLVLTLQTAYFGHIYPRLKASRNINKAMPTDQVEGEGRYSEDGRSSVDKHVNCIVQPRPKSESVQSSTMSSPIPLPAALQRSKSTEHGSYYRSARYLSTSHTPTRTSFIAPWRAHTSMDADHSVEEPLLGGSLPARPVHPPKTKTLLCAVSALSFIFATQNISSTRNSSSGLVFELQNTVPGHVHRKLLQQRIQSASGGYGGIGTYMGWGMAAIYVGGRLPQIGLNIRRGNVEGLSPLMFIFALLGNTTYVASILVNSLDWLKLRPNLPWLVDAAGCTLLDTFILCQFMYYKYWQSRHVTETQV